MNNLYEIADIFKINILDAHKTILSFSNREAIRILETEDSLFNHAFEEIKNTSDRLMSSDYIISGLHKSSMIPFDYHPRVYFLYKECDLVYIGKTADITARISTHLKTKEFDAVSTIIVPRAELSITEDLNIHYYKPALNKGIMNGCMYLNLVLKNCIFV